MKSIHLGYAVGSGEVVEIPLKHMVVTGQTQQAGKTTALEALVSRANVRAVTFVTKRGERVFMEGRRIQPYFRERADWQFVGSLIDATLNEKNRFIRSWLMKVCAGTETLAEVYANVQREKKAARRGIDEGVYTQIEAYLDLVIPQLKRAPFVSAVHLYPGLNVMDLSPYSPELQGLVIRSVIEHVYEKEKDVVTVIPEAWEFLPEGRGSPVKLAAETLIRKGAALGNYMWVDAQDLGGLWKTVVRAAAVYLVGVQREANEVKRTLANLPASTPKLKAADVASLGLGEFYVCHGQHAIKTYVQPLWMASAAARAAATGAGRKWTAPALPRPDPEDIVTPAEATRLERENERLSAENKDLRKRLEALERRQDGQNTDIVSRDDGPSHSGGTPLRGSTAGISIRAVDASSGDAGAGSERGRGDGVDDGLYAAIRERLLREEPALALAIAQTRPEIEVRVTRQTIAMTDETLIGRCAILIADDWFREAKGTTSTLKELRRRGYQGADNTRRDLDKLTEKGFLTKEDGGYQAVASMKVRIVES